MALIPLPDVKPITPQKTNFRSGFSSGRHHFITPGNVYTGRFDSIDILEDSVFAQLEIMNPADPSDVLDYITLTDMPTQLQGYPTIICDTVFVKIELTSGLVRVNR